MRPFTPEERARIDEWVGKFEDNPAPDVAALLTGVLYVKRLLQLLDEETRSEHRHPQD